MTTVSRRNLIKAGLAAVGTLGSHGGWTAMAAAATPKVPAASRRYRWTRPVARRRPDSLPFPDLPVGTDTLPEIDHIVVLMMENHSYDNYLGMLRRGDGFSLGRDGLPLETNPTATPGQLLRAFHMPTECQQDGHPSQEWVASHVQYDGGRNDGFVVSPSGPVAMGYWEHSDLPFAYSLASTFALCDRWFCSLLGQTFPNRRYLMAATSAGMVDDVVGQLETAAPNGTIFDRLEQHHVAWRDYHHSTGPPSTGVWLSEPSARSANNVSIDSFFVDAASGNLPGFSIVDPDFANQSEEDPQDISVGQAFVWQVVHAILESPAWKRTLLVWTYDEHGGYFDHVPPPPAIPPDSVPPKAPAGASAYDGFARYGFRVPAVVVSPYARRSSVSHVILDHTSILATVERKWNLPALTWRDANANNLLHLLDLRHPTFAEPPPLARPRSSPAACSPGQAGTIPPAGALRPG